MEDCARTFDTDDKKGKVRAATQEILVFLNLRILTPLLKNKSW